jgi:hypothetical protein
VTGLSLSTRLSPVSTISFFPAYRSFIISAYGLLELMARPSVAASATVAEVNRASTWEESEVTTAGWRRVTPPDSLALTRRPASHGLAATTVTRVKGREGGGDS